MKWVLLIGALAFVGAYFVQQAIASREREALQRAAEDSRQKLCETLKRNQAHQFQIGYPKTHIKELPQECYK